jgi:acyl transferase domain-containing protein/glutamate-1-semialdehyde aminotransferase
MNDDNTFGPRDIAIIGMTGRFPGANTLDEFWRNLRDGVESISFFTDDELRAEGVDPAVLSDPNYVKAKGILAGAESFDAPFFGFNPREAQITDPQHRVFLECAWEVLESAGYHPQIYEGRIGVYAGVGMNTYLFNLFTNREAIRAVSGFQLMIGNDKDYLTTRVSYKLNLKGPSVDVQTSCSTSLVAVSMACQSLLNGECDMALAGAVSIKFPQISGYFYQPEGIVSRDGHCRAFDAKAQGHAGGNGAGIVVLKRMADALADGDHIRAVIRGFAVNNDGSLKIGFTAPSVTGQADVVTEALAMAGIEAQTVTYVEAHGTATALGDTVEIEALTQAFRSSTQKKNFCAVGSVKTNIGHTDSAAGVAGLIKTVLALEHRQLPPSLFYEEPNSQIDFANSPFFVNDKLREWKKGETPRRAGVSSFGIGGTNAHVIVEEAPAREASEGSWPWHLLVLSALTPAALEKATANLVDYLEHHRDANIADVAYTLQVGRKAFSYRRMLVCRDFNDAVTTLKTLDPKRVLTVKQESEERPIAFMFPGQGTQYVNAALELYENEPTFREHVDRCSELLLPELRLDLRSILYPQGATSDEAAHQLGQTGVTQPALFVIESALARMWMKWGVLPQAMIGHSIGEYVAAYAAGVFSLEEGLKIVAARGRLMQKLPLGGMLAIGLPENQVQALLGGQLTLAAINAPSLCVVSGPTEAIQALQDQLSGQETICRRLRTSHAFHSKMMDPVLAPFAQQLRSVKLRPPRIPFASNLTGTWITAAEATNAGYWASHLRQAVKFADGLGELLREPEQILLEVGPGRTLQTLARQHPEKSAGHILLSTLRDPHDHQPELASLLGTLGQLWLAGAQIDWAGFYARERRHHLPLPTYPFERERHWIEASTYAVQASAPEANDRAKPTAKVATTSLKAAVPTTMKEAETLKAGSQIGAVPEESRAARILQKLRTIFTDLTGIDALHIDVQASFFELGADSLLLIQATHAIQDKFDIKISLRQLFEELSTLNALATFLEEQLPAEELSAGPSLHEPVSDQPPDFLDIPHGVAAQPMSNNDGRESNAIVEAGAGGVLDRLMAQQLRVMSQQLDLLRDGLAAGKGMPHMETNELARVEQGVEPETASPETPSLNLSAVKISESESPEGGPEPFVPFQPVEIGRESGLTPDQQKHLDGLIARFTEATPGSKRLTQRYRPYLADPRASVGFRRAWKEIMYPIIVQRSSGSRVWDVDGNEYVDFTMGFGVHLFGHSPPFIIEALEDQLRQGVSLGPQSSLAGEVAEMICEMTGVERVTFCNSGTEAVMTALRLARSVTRRPKIALFTGSYHGSFDGVLARARNLNGKIHAIPMAPGVLPQMIEDVLVLNYDSPESLDLLRTHADELAAVLVEPVQSRRPDLQPRQFLHELRALTEKFRIALIFDEVITGFRVHPGGAQAWFGVQADLVTYGKVVGGGMPIGVVAGNAAYMDAVDGGMWRFGDSSYPQAPQTFFAGTFCKHPLAMAAALAVLKQLRTCGGALQQQLNDQTAKLASTLDAHFEQLHLPVRIAHFGSIFRFNWPRELHLMDLLSAYLIEKGVYVWEGGTRFLSTAHSADDVDYFIGAVKDSVEKMLAGGFIHPVSPHSPNGAGLPVPQSLDETKDQGGSSPAPVGAPAVTSSDSSYETDSNGLLRVPLTEGQKQIWTMAHMGEDASSAYNESVTLDLRGPFSLAAMRLALQRVVERHEALRATFSPDGDYQLIAPRAPVEIPLCDFSNSDQSRREEEVTAWLNRETRQPFDLSRGPLLRAGVGRLEERHHLLVLTIHHLITDGWSNGIVLQDLRAFYDAACQGLESHLSRPVQYSKYAQRQTQQQQSQKSLADKAYWLDQFSGPIPVLELPTDRLRSREQTYTGDCQSMGLEPILYHQLKRLSAQQGSTLYITLLAGFKLLLHRLTSQDDVIVGISSAGQQAAGGECLVGYCVNVLPLRNRIRDDAKFTEFLGAVRRVLLNAYDHQDYSYGQLIRKLNLPREPGRSPLISAFFNMDRPAGSLIDFYDLEGSVQTNFSGSARWELTWNVTETSGDLLLESVYRTDLFDPPTIRRWMEIYQTILRIVASRPDISLRVLGTTLDEAERQQQVVQAMNLKETTTQKFKAIKRRAG